MVLNLRVESGSDDPDNLSHLGHFFGGSSGSHLQAKLSGCDPDIACSLENNFDIWYVSETLGLMPECTETIIGMKPAVISMCCPKITYIFKKSV